MSYSIYLACIVGPAMPSRLLSIPQLASSMSARGIPVAALPFSYISNPYQALPDMAARADASTPTYVPGEAPRLRARASSDVSTPPTGMM